MPSRAGPLPASRHSNPGLRSRSPTVPIETMMGFRRTGRISAIRKLHSTRARSSSRSCATGYQNPDTLSCVSPSDVHWVEGSGFPNAGTVGRNTLHTGGTNNFDLNLTKSIPLGETRRLEFRWEALNAFNHPQFIQVPQKNVNGTLPGRFLNRDFTDSGIRTMWVQAKVVF